MEKRELRSAHEELFRRGPDEMFQDMQSLFEHCRLAKERSSDLWKAPSSLRLYSNGALGLDLGEGCPPFRLNDWSFGQLCSLAGVSKDTLNRFSPDTARRGLEETLPGGNKPFQLLAEEGLIRSIHGTAYTRLHNADLVSMLMEYATDFTPPQRAGAVNPGATGLYCGEQDMFCFLIDPTGWAEIGGEVFAPGFFAWNSEVGRRSVGVSTFWFQAVCRNHIVWDATEVVEFARKHTGRVGEALGDIRRIIEGLVAKRDARRDGFVGVMRAAMEHKLGDDSKEAMMSLAKAGVGRGLAKRALELAAARGRLTIFTVVDALTRLAVESAFAGDRLAADEKASSLLNLVA